MKGPTKKLREKLSDFHGLQKIKDLHIHANLKTLNERADALKEAQLDRLNTPEAGRAILRRIGYATDHLATLPNRSPEETTMQLTLFAPLTRNMRKDREERWFERPMDHIDFV